MHIKDFFDQIQHRFRNAHVMDDRTVDANIIDWADNIIGKFKYELDSQELLAVECYPGPTTYSWGSQISEDPSTTTKNFPEILSILRGMLESKNQFEIIEDIDADKLIQSFLPVNQKLVIEKASSLKQQSQKYCVQLDIKMYFDSDNMDDALSQALRSLNIPKNVEYKIIKETVSRDNESY